MKLRASFLRHGRYLSFAITCLLGGNIVADEIRPAYLELGEITQDHYQVVWKQPIVADRRLPIDPVLPAACETLREDLPEYTNNALIQRWEVACDLRSGSVHISGLTRTLTDVMVRISYLNGDNRTELLRSDKPGLNLAEPTPPIASYLQFGVEHLVFSIDHVLFVIGLVLFIRNPLMLLKTITAFTLAHSITLALSVLDVVRIPQEPVEAVIALSILFLARELIVPPERRSMITQLRPWLMAFAFGLLHGFGFAGALMGIGLPQEQLAMSLFLFNVGIEVGQLCIIAIMLSGAWLITKTGLFTSERWVPAFTYAMGGMATFWTLDRVLLVF